MESYRWSVGVAERELAGAEGVDVPTLCRADRMPSSRGPFPDALFGHSLIGSASGFSHSQSIMSGGAFLSVVFSRDGPGAWWTPSVLSLSVRRSGRTGCGWSDVVTSSLGD